MSGWIRLPNIEKGKMTERKKMYWGDNSAHEFWESEDHEVLILRNHGERYWTAHRNHGFLFGCGSAEDAAERLNAELSQSQTWAKQVGGKYALKNVIAGPQPARQSGGKTANGTAGLGRKDR